MSQVSWSQIAESGPDKWGVRVKTDGRCPYSPGDTIAVSNRKGETKQVTLGSIHARWNYGARTTVVVFKVAGRKSSGRTSMRARVEQSTKLEALRAAYRAARAAGEPQEVLDNIIVLANAVKRDGHAYNV